MNQETYQVLAKQDWGSIGKELVAHAIFASKALGWGYGDLVELGNGISPSDIAEQAVEGVFSGKLKWEASRGALVPFLKQWITWKLYDQAKIRRKRVPLPETEDGTLAVAREYEAGRLLTPEEDLIAHEDDCPADEKIGQIFSCVEGHPELESIVSAIMDGCEPQPRFLAEWLKIDIDEVTRRLRRLRYRLENIGKGRR